MAYAIYQRVVAAVRKFRRMWTDFEFNNRNFPLPGNVNEANIVARAIQNLVPNQNLQLIPPPPVEVRRSGRLRYRPSRYGYD